MNSLAKCGAGETSKTFNYIDESKGSPAIKDQWSKACTQKAYPDVWILNQIYYLKSVSKPKESIAGILALTVYKGLPGFAVSDITWPLLLYKTK
jgi:hypothetical protein